MKNTTSFIILCLALVLSIKAQTSPVSFELSTAHRGSVIGPLHYGIFYEEINHAGDGGLYGELIRNGSLEENGSNPDYWWTIADATFSISSQNLLNGAQKRAMHLNMKKAGDGTRNIGYWGINSISDMKKTYLIPQMHIIAVQLQNIIATSQTGSITSTGLDGIQYEEQAASGLSADVKANTIEWDIWQ